ncbi:hypothetical protein SY88_21550 [Clostridiales bacterium PH28_bin88]|nr:hypothetical protein SY88_21550 [Clostridiales bacterium PH28_bin88]
MSYSPCLENKNYEVIYAVKRKLFLATLSVLLILNFVATPILAKNSNNRTDYVDILVEKGVDREDLAKLKVDSLESLVWQANAYNFTDEQVQLYIKGLLSEFERDFTGKMYYQGRVMENGLIETSDGILMPNRYANKKINDFENYDSDNVGIMSYTGNYRSVTDSSDQSGTYWLVKSEPGYREATAFAALPTINSMALNDRAYMFFAANTNPTSIAGDYGVVYYIPSAGSTGSWYPFKLTAVWNDSTKQYDTDWKKGNAIPSSITQVYLHIKVTTTATNDTVELRVLNANDFSEVLWTWTETFYNNPIDSTYSNLNLYREITMAQVHDEGTPLDTNTGSWFSNAIFSNAYIYSTGGYWQWGTTQTNDAYIKAPTTSQLSAITVNSYSKWYAENISMRWNIPIP